MGNIANDYMKFWFAREVFALFFHCCFSSIVSECNFQWKVSYEMFLPLRYNLKLFNIILHSGASWHALNICSVPDTFLHGQPVSSQLVPPYLVYLPGIKRKETTRSRHRQWWRADIRTCTFLRGTVAPSKWNRPGEKPLAVLTSPEVMSC